MSAPLATDRARPARRSGSSRPTERLGQRVHPSLAEYLERHLG